MVNDNRNLVHILHESKSYLDSKNLNTQSKAELDIESNTQSKAQPNTQSNVQPKVTLLVAFYNAPKLLELLFASIENQSFKNFEVILCDDGSNPETLAQIKPWIQQASFPIRHLWHEDLGFRKNRILNWGIHFSRAECLVFIDQDCMLHKDFLKEHYESFSKDSVLCGRRMDLTPWVSKMLTPKRMRDSFIEKNFWWIMPTGLYMKDNNGKKGIHLKKSNFRDQLNKKYRGIVGCNFSVAKENLLKINGFDNCYEGPGIGEDSDIEYRLSLLGLKMQSFAHAAVQFHVYHRLLKRENRNDIIFAETQKHKQMVALQGIQQQLADIRR